VGEWSASRLGRFTPRKINLVIHCIKSLCGLLSQSGHFVIEKKCPCSVENRTSTPRFSQQVPSSVDQLQNDRLKPRSSPVYLRCRVNCVMKDGLRKEVLI
jgi:hypothetical protein